MAHDEDTSRRRFLKAAGTAAAAASLAGCTGGEEGQGTTTDEETTTESGGTETEAETETDVETTEDEGGDEQEAFEVTITQGQMPTGLDPHDHRETPTDNVMLHAYEGVLSRDREGNVVNALATEYERVEDGLVRFTIREDVTFHNGDDLTPEDVAYSVNRIVDPDVDFESPQNDQLSGVTGAEVGDGNTVEVSSDGFNPTVFSSFATYGDVVQQSWIENNDSATINQSMNGTGPFQLSNYSQDESVVFERYDDYWDDPADVSQLTFLSASESSTRVNQLLNGETDVIVNVPPQDANRVRQNDGTGLSAVPSTRLLFAAMRYDVEPFSSQQFRQAMNYAVDLEGIIENVLQTFGDPTGQPTLEGFVGHNPDVEPYPHDPDQAESLVEESGHAGVEITLDGPTGRYLRDVEIAQAVADQIDSLSNVSCSYNQREFASLAGEATSGNIKDSPHFYLLGWGEATFEGVLTIGALMTSDGALTSFSNDQIDQLHADAQSESDEEQRVQTIQELNSVIHDQAPWVFLNRQYSVYGVNERVAWDARTDERIDAYAMSPADQ